MDDDNAASPARLCKTNSMRTDPHATSLHDLLNSVRDSNQGVKKSVKVRRVFVRGEGADSF